MWSTHRVLCSSLCPIDPCTFHLEALPSPRTSQHPLLDSLLSAGLKLWVVAYMLLSRISRFLVDYVLTHFPAWSRIWAHNCSTSLNSPSVFLTPGARCPCLAPWWRTPASAGYFCLQGKRQQGYGFQIVLVGSGSCSWDTSLLKIIPSCLPACVLQRLDLGQIKLI